MVSIETNDRRKFDEGLVKQLTGSDRIKARFMRKDFFEFDPTHKLWLATNHKPVITGTDLGIWRRIRLIPFNVQIPDNEVDKRLPEKLTAELPGILAWAVQGCLDWQQEGLDPPECVLHATNQYQSEMDKLAGFIAECCVVHRNAKGTAKELYKTYSEWCEECGEYAESQRKFGMSLTERGFERIKHGTGWVWRGIGLNE